MPNVYNVSEITNILSGIIQDQSLQDVKVQGEVLVGGPSSVFFLSHAGKKLVVLCLVAKYLNSNLYWQQEIQ